MQHAPGPEFLLELGVLGIVRTLRLLLSVQVIEVAEELVKAVDGRQKLIAIAEVVLAELAGGVAQGLQELGDGGIFRLQTELRAGKSYLGEAGADRRLAGDEGSAPGRATLLA